MPVVLMSTMENGSCSASASPFLNANQIQYSLTYSETTTISNTAITLPFLESHSKHTTDTSDLFDVLAPDTSRWCLQQSADRFIPATAFLTKLASAFFRLWLMSISVSHGTKSFSYWQNVNLAQTEICYVIFSTYSLLSVDYEVQSGWLLSSCC